MPIIPALLKLSWGSLRVSGRICTRKKFSENIESIKVITEKVSYQVPGRTIDSIELILIYLIIFD